ncbi:C40 family peptidase [Craterilacuibacter sp. RT1T]|uniref:C40 family peptidase n=1 Tax=Craterilacuibacter sp. RT1T TaxID=2942211 RepID=UPI0020BEBE5E|nr:C40 family peptidase [Craterilacuibacter sp. RT1T]MCL6262384.1 C40 family peptidase [Craterilacuibacter sp. RT1T]
MTFAYAAPEAQVKGFATSEEQSDPIARFASAPGEEAVGDLLLQAMSLIGVAYRFGGNSPASGLDCSGFIKYVFEKSLKVNLPRTAAEMARAGRAVERDELAAGDLVFFNTRGFRNSHAGIYLGGNKFIHAPRSGKNIEVSNMTGSYWVSRYNGARRVQRGQPVQLEAAAEHPVRSREAAAPVARATSKSKANSRNKVVAGKKSTAQKSSVKSRTSTRASAKSSKASSTKKQASAKKAPAKKTSSQKKSS